MLGEQIVADVGSEIAKVAAHLPLGRIGRAEDFGALAAFLASEQADQHCRTRGFRDFLAGVGGNHLIRAADYLW
ncbi:hypothetical protein ACWGCW_29765 [Streptomyces sp. NPDC054933]